MIAAAQPLRALRRVPLLAFLALYTILTGGPFLWVASMSLRTTNEIFAAPYALPAKLHWEKFVEAWTRSNYGTYFWNSVIVVVTSVVLLTVIGAMVAHCLARRRWSGGSAARCASWCTRIGASGPGTAGSGQGSGSWSMRHHWFL